MPWNICCNIDHYKIIKLEDWFNKNKKENNV